MITICIIIYVIGVFGWYFFGCYKEGHYDYEGKFHNGLDEFQIVGIFFWPISLIAYIVVNIIYYVLAFPFKLVERMAGNAQKMKNTKSINKIIK